MIHISQIEALSSRVTNRLIPLLIVCLGTCGTAAWADTGRYEIPANHRIEKTINREWTFNYFPNEHADSNGCQMPDFDDSAWPAIAIPHTWQTFETTGKVHPYIHDADEKSDSYWWRGWGWYRKHFSISKDMEGRKVFVEFDAVQKYCEVWVNGKLAGDHKGGYDGFFFDITDLVHFGGDNVLAVAVNADQNDRFKIPPMSAGNWNTYGGIYRDARIVIKDSLYIPFQGSYKQEGGTFVTTPQVADAAAQVRVRTWVENDGSDGKDCELRTTIADAAGNIVQVSTAQKTIAPSKLMEFDQTNLNVLSPHLWSPETPYVYTVYSDVMEAGKVVDHFESPLGIREFKWDYGQNRLILNGKKVIIHGSNHHQEYPWLGDATPKWMLLLDMQDFRYNLNHNFMRTAHYPNDPCIYDFNDRNGIITIEELPNDKRQQFDQSVQIQQLREAIRRDRNHPSIFFWSMGNETDHAVDSKYAVAEDTTRIIHAREIYNDSAGKFVTHTQKQLALESLLRCTIRGWYNSDVRDLEPQSVQQTGNEEWQHDVNAAEIIKRNQGRTSEDRANLNTWIYEDHGCDRQYLNCPLDYVNPKGFVDSWRTPKYFYYLWEALYATKPMVFIHPHFWRSQYLGKKKEIVVDSNCDSVELKVNGRSIGVLKPTFAEANVVRFENVPIEKGVLTAEGRRGNQIITSTVVMAGPAARVTVSVNPGAVSAGLDSLAIVRADIVDANGVHVYGATNSLEWSVSGPATLVGAPVYTTDTDKNEAKEGTMYIDAPAFNIIRSSGTPGAIKVEARSPGLEAGGAIIMATNALEDSSTTIVEPPLPATKRLAVAHEPGGEHRKEFAEMQTVPADISLNAGGAEDYARWIDDFLRDKNPRLDFSSPEYRAVISVFTRLLKKNHGKLVRDDFNFTVGVYNDCRRITRKIDSMDLPESRKESLHEQYAHEMIEKGEAKNYETEIARLRSLKKQKASGKSAFDSTRVDELRKQISDNFFVPSPLPDLAAHTYRTFNPAPGVKAEAVAYATQLGARVPAILYLPDPMPKTASGKIPAFIVVNGHGGDKYSWYSYYTGILFARGGVAVLTYDQAGEGERNRDRRSGTREHDEIKGDSLLARHLAGLMITDVRQAVSYLRQRPEIDSQRIAAGGYSLGSFVLALAGALDPHLHACVLAGGGDLDGPGGYWDSSGKKMCQALPYQSLSFLGDRGAVIYALHAARGPLLIYNGLGDDVVAIPSHSQDFFNDLRARTIALCGESNSVFETEFAPVDAGHRPYWVTRPVVEWLEKQIDFPNWTEKSIATMPEIKISDWAKKNNATVDKLYATDKREGGTPALEAAVPGIPRDELNVFSADEWAAVKKDFILETWVQSAKKDVSPMGLAAKPGGSIP